jgi:hypothetical protein
MGHLLVEMSENKLVVYLDFVMADYLAAELEIVMDSNLAVSWDCRKVVHSDGRMAVM